MASVEISARVSTPPLVSVVVNNYNYEAYLEQAIESALAQTYPHVEVIVVDDGSTDGSRRIIERFGDRVTAVLKENGGQGSALNAGFERSSGSLIMFLDSDDYLFETAVERVVAVFGSRLAKVQFRLMVVDGDGRRAGEYPPQGVPLHRGDVVPLLLKRAAYASAVTSGNAYSRSALEFVLPIPGAEFRLAADGYLNAAVPFHGEVGAIDEVLGAYRIHGRNAFAMTGSLDVALFHTIVKHQLATEQVILRMAQSAGYSVQPGLVLHNVGHLDARLASLRLDPEQHPVPGDRRLRLVTRGAVASWRYVDISLVRRIAWIVSFIAAGLLPRGLAMQTVSWRWSRSERPAVVRYLVRALRHLTL